MRGHRDSGVGGAGLATGLMALLIGGTSCSDEFAKCEAAKTCDTSTGTGGTDAGLNGSGGSSETGGTGGSTGGGANGGAAGESASGGTGGTGEGGAHPDASTSADAGKPDAGPPPCSTMDGGISRDPDHCGACNIVCSADGVENRACTDGLCKPSCDATHADCNKDGKDGCEVTPATDPDFCGGCDVKCLADGVETRSCTDGKCTPKCDPTHADCNKDGKDGCEVTPADDELHCGSCDVTCKLTGATSTTCVDGKCKPACDATHADCNKDGADGCEVSIATDADNCGACDYACSSSQVKARHCVAGACVPECATGRGDCGKPSPAADDGCETDVTTSTNCGTCGHDCLGGACTSLQCEAVTIASGLGYISAFTVDSNYVYYVDYPASGTGHVVRTGHDGANGITLASGFVNATALVSDTTYLYVATNGGPSLGDVNSGIRRVVAGDTASQTPIPIITGQSSTLMKRPGLLAVDSTKIYWVDSGYPAAFSITKGGLNPTQINTTAFDQNWIPSDVAIDATDLYIMHGTYLLSVPLASGAPKSTTINQGASPNLAIDANFVFFRMYDTVAAAPAMGRMQKGKTGLINATTVAPASYFEGAMAVDGKYLYFVDDGLYRVSKTANGGTRVRISTATSKVAKIFALTENGETVLYWMNQLNSSSGAGSIVRLAP